MKYDVVTRFYRLNTGADALDYAGTLVAEQVRQKFVGALGSLNFIDLSPTNSTVPELYVHLPV